MANVIDLALKVTGDATGLAKSLTPAERALDNLAKQAEKATRVFEPFAKTSAAAAEAQEELGKRFDELAQQLSDKAISPKEFAENFAALTTEAKAAAAAFAEGIKIAEERRTEEEKLAIEIERITGLLEKKAISEELAADLTREATAAAQEAIDKESGLADARDAAQKIIQANLSEYERAQQTYNDAVSLALDLEEKGLLTREQATAEIERQSAALAKAADAAGDAGDATEEAGLKFNEISGFIGLLPGPIGSIASRISSLASSAEGLGKVLENPAQAIAGLGRSLAFLVTPAGLATAAVAGLSAAAAGLKNLEGELDALTKTATKLGVSFQFVETLQLSAEMAGVSFGTVNSAMTRLLRTLAGADEESKKAADSLNAVGLSFDDIKDKGSEEQIRLFGERLNAIEDPAKRAAAATALFGNAGSELLPAFEGIADAEKILGRFNARISDIDRERVLALGDSFDAVGASLKGFGNELLTPFVGIVQSLSDSFATAIATVGRNIGAVLDALSPLFSAVGVVINVFVQLQSTLANLVGTAFEPLAAYGKLLSSAFDAISRAVTEFFGRINDAINSLREFLNFGESVTYLNDAFDYLWKTAERVGAILSAAFSKLAEVIGNTVGDTIDTVKAVVNGFLEFTGLSDVVYGFAEGVTSAFTSLWEGIKAIVSQIGGFIESVLKFAEDWLGIKSDFEEPVTAEIDVKGGEGIAELLTQNKDLQKTLDSITSSVSKAIDDAAKFGDAGFDAALKYQEAIDDLKDKLDRGLFNEETFKREAEKAGAAFEAEINRIEENVKFDLQESEETKKTLDSLQLQINKTIEGAEKFGQAGFNAAQQYQDKLKELGAQFEDGRINAATLSAEVEKATAEYDKQVDGMKQIEALQQSLLKADKDRVAALIQQEDKTTDLEKNMAAVQREQLRLEEEIQKRRKEGAVFAADAAAARLAELDQLEAKLVEQQQAEDQGFADGFNKAFEETNKSIGDVINKAAEFGSVGAAAAQRLQAGIASAQEQAKAGIFSAQTYQAEVDRQNKLFDDRLAAAKRVEDFMLASLDVRQRAELDAQKQLEERKKQAALNIEALQEQIREEEMKIEKARDEGRLKDARAAKERQTQLVQAQRAEQSIVDSRGASARSQTSQFQQAASVAAQQFRQLGAEQSNTLQTAAKNLYSTVNSLLTDTSAAAAEQARRLEILLAPIQGSVKTADIRTAEGAATVLNLGTLAQDPALIEARLQTKQLQLINRSIVNTASQALQNSPIVVF